MANNPNEKVVQNKATKPARPDNSEIRTNNERAVVRDMFRLYTIIETDEQEDNLIQNAGNQTRNLNSQASSSTSISLPSTETTPILSGAGFTNPNIKFLPTFRRSQRNERRYTRKAGSSQSLTSPINGDTTQIPSPRLSDFLPKMSFKPILRLKPNVANLRAKIELSQCKTVKTEIKITSLLERGDDTSPGRPAFRLPAMTPSTTRSMGFFPHPPYKGERTLPTNVKYISRFQLERIDEECYEILPPPIISDLNSQLMPAVDLARRMTTQEEFIIILAMSQLEQEDEKYSQIFREESEPEVTDENTNISFKIRLLPNSATRTWYRPSLSPPAIITEIPATSQLEEEDQDNVAALVVGSQAEAKDGIKDIWSTLRLLPYTALCAWYNPPMKPLTILTVIPPTLQFEQKFQVYIANTLIESRAKGRYTSKLDRKNHVSSRKQLKAEVTMTPKLLWKQDDPEDPVSSLERASSSRINARRTNVSSKVRVMGKGPFLSGTVKVSTAPVVPLFQENEKRCEIPSPLKTRDMTIADIIAKFKQASDDQMYSQVYQSPEDSGEMQMEPLDEKYSAESLQARTSPKRIVDFTQSVRSEQNLESNSVQSQVRCSRPPTPRITDITPTLPRDLFRNRERPIGDSVDIKPRHVDVRKDTRHELQSSFKTNEIPNTPKPSRKIGPKGKVAFFSSHSEFFEKGKKLHRTALKRKIIDAGSEKRKAVPYAYCMNSFYSNQNHNLDVICEGMVFSVHLAVLQTHSKYFQRLKIPDQRYVLLPITSNGFRMVYNWIRDPKPDMKFDGIVDLYLAAEFLEINNLRDLAWGYMDDVERFSEANAYFLYRKARILKCKKVVQLTVKRISKFFLVIVGSKDYLEFDFDEVMLFLKSSYIAVHSELEVLFCGIRWINHDWKNRMKHFLDVVMCVRYTMMCPIHLVGLTSTFLQHEPKKNMAILMLKDEGLQATITSAYHYVIRRQSDPQISKNMNVRAGWLQKYNLVEEQPRCYIRSSGKGDHYIGKVISNVYSEFEYTVKKINNAHPCSLMKPQK